MSPRRNRALLALAGLGVAATCVLAAGVGPASADPTPTPGQAAAGTDTTLIAGVGADADAELIDAIAADYNGTKPSATVESFDAVNPVTGAVEDTNTSALNTKPGCSIARANGSGEGLTALSPNTVASTSSGGDGSSPCVDFARSSSAKAASGQGNLTFYALATDAVTWVTVTGAYAPSSLSVAQLKGIFTCATTDWSQVGGQAGPIHLYVPTSSAATYTFFLKALGLTPTSVPAGCSTLEQQNDGTTINGDPEGIAPYAIGKWAAQSNHEVDPTVAVRDVRGGTVLGSSIATTGGAYVNPLTPTTSGTTNYQVANTGFTPAFTRKLYDVVLNSSSTTPAPPTYLGKTQADALFGPAGYFCSSNEFTKYGFTVLGSGGCGQTS